MNKKRELLKETGTSALKGAIGAVPYVGTALNEMIFETRNRIKQNRINSFIENFSNYLSGFNETDVDTTQVQSAEFGDFFEEIILKVSTTHSVTKLEAFKCLLVNQLVKAKDINYAELMLNIVGTLQEKQISILSGFYDNSSSLFNQLKIDLLDLNKQYNSLDEDIVNEPEMYKKYGEEFQKEISLLKQKKKKINELIEKTKEHIEEKKEPFLASTYNCEKNEFNFLIHDLSNKGLLIDLGAKYGAEPLTIMEITHLGIDLIDYIME